MRCECGRYTHEVSTTLSCAHFFMNCWPLNMIVRCRLTCSVVPSAQIVTITVTFLWSAPPCLCCTFMPQPPTTHSVPWSEGGQPLSSIAYRSSTHTPVFTTNSSTNSNHLFFVSGFSTRACWVSNGLLQWVCSTSQWWSKNYKTQFSPSSVQSAPRRFLHTQFTYCSILWRVMEKPQSANSLTNSTMIASSAGVIFCCSSCASHLLLPPPLIFYTMFLSNFVCTPSVCEVLMSVHDDMCPLHPVSIVPSVGSASVMGLGETLHLSSHKYTGPLSIVKIAKVCTVVVVKGEKCLCK